VIAVKRLFEKSLRRIVAMHDVAFCIRDWLRPASTAWHRLHATFETAGTRAVRWSCKSIERRFGSGL